MIELPDISKLSIGCAGFGNEYEDMSIETSKSIVNMAIKNGINYFDTSPFYGETKSELVLGECIKDIPRESYFISTKVGRYSNSEFNYGYDSVIKSVYGSMNRLGIEVIDLVQCHDIDFCDSLNIIINETLPALEKLKKDNKIRYIGITGLHLSQLDYVIKKSNVKIDTVLTYCNYTLFNDTLNLYSKDWLRKGIKIIQGGVTSMGLLTTQGPQDWHPAPELIKSTCKEVVNNCVQKKINITEIAFKHVFNNNEIYSLLIGVTNLEQLNEYLNWCNNTNENYLNLIIFIKDKFKLIHNCLWIEN
jgi:L-galactose dehydrogenase